MQALIAREERIGRASGYVNKGKLYQAAVSIENDREEIAREYQLYRKHGGKRALAAL